MPLDAEAQGWSWIRKLSGPEFRTFEVFQASACIAGKRCVEGAVLPLGLVGVGAKLTGRNLFTDDHPAENEMQIGVLVEHAGDGENLERGIDDVDLWIIEPQWRLLLRSWVLPRPDPNRDGDSNWRVFPVVTVGLASYRFSGNDLDTFWTSAITPSLSGRVEYQYFFVQGGVKLHYFFDSLPSQYFGGTPEGDVPGTEYGFSAFVHAGFRFGGF
jgi:hypothetical protein